MDNEKTGQWGELWWGEEVDAALIALLAHVACSDGEVDDRELAFLQRLFHQHGGEELRRAIVSFSSEPLDVKALSEALGSMEERARALHFGVRMAWKDGVLDRRERTLLERVAVQFGFTTKSIDRIIEQVHAQIDHRVTRTDIHRAVREVDWGAVQLASGEVQSDLVMVLPEDVEVHLRVGLANVEMLLLCDEGLCGRFSERNTWIQWSEIVSYTRVPTFGSAVQLHLEDGRSYTLVDLRLRHLGVFLDHLYGTPERVKAEPLRFERRPPVHT